MHTRPATAADRPVIEHLLELYLYDMAEIYDFPVGPDGLYHYDRLDEFWVHPHLILSDDDIAGFALIIDHCPISGRKPCRFMAEFFILRPYRRRGFGAEAARHLIDAHPGPWHIGVIDRNAPATRFWEKLLASRATPSPLRYDDEDWLLYAFDSQERGAPGGRHRPV